MGISRSTALALRDRGHEAIHLLELGLQRLGDPAIVELARRESRIILTVDLDFGVLLARDGQSRPSVVIFRLADQKPARITRTILELIHREPDALAGGAIVIAEEGRFRIRRLPIRPSS